MIYLDNAATTLHKPEQVVQAVLEAMGSMGNASRGAHDGSLCAARAVYEARAALATLFGCPRADHVAFAANATEALNIAINGIVNEGDHVVSTDLEHNSVLRPLYRLERERGVRLDFARADANGNIDYDELAGLIDPKTRLIVTTHASNLTGNMLDVARIGALAKQRGILYLLDASQTAGAYPINITDMGVDVLCFTGHKSLMGPQGTGGLCVGNGVEIRPWKVGGTGVQSYSTTQPAEYPARLEAGTLNGHGIAGLGAAVKFIQETGVETIHRAETRLMRRFYEGVRTIDGVCVYGDFRAERAPIVALNIRDYDSARVADELMREYDIAVRAGAHCAPRMHRALGTSEQGAVRFSFGYYNTDAETDKAILAVRSIAAC